MKAETADWLQTLCEVCLALADRALEAAKRRVESGL
jgi:hypothetical protein